MLPRDISLFLRSARTDATIAAQRKTLGDAAAFDAAYAKGDPWASADPRFRYQRHKYQVLASLIPQRAYDSALDLGCGAGLLTAQLAPKAAQVLGIDIAANAVTQAAAQYAHLPNLRFQQGDIRNLDPALNHQFDLLMLADSLYYLPAPLEDATLKQLAARLALLLRPGGICMLANHFFSGADADSRLSQRIHHAFTWSPGFNLKAAYRKPFYLVSVLERV